MEEITPRSKNLEDMAYEDLLDIAASEGIEIPDDMGFSDIIAAIEEQRQAFRGEERDEDDDDFYAVEKMDAPKFNETDDFVLAPPFGRRTEAIENVDSMVPGDFKVAKDGTLLKTWFEYEGNVGSLIDVYDNWIINILEKQINSRTLDVPKGKISFQHKFLIPPRIVTSRNSYQPLYPITATTAALTYSAELYVTMVLNKGQKNEEVLPNKLFIGRIPVMIGSILDNLRQSSAEERQKEGMCTSDKGGYFIVNGNEKVVLIQENLRVGRIFAFTNAKEQICRMTVNTPIGSSIVTLGYKPKDQSIVISLPFMGHQKTKSKKIGNNISVFQVFRILGVGYDEMQSYVLKYVRPEWRNRVANKLLGSILVYHNVRNDLQIIKELLEEKDKKDEKPEKKRKKREVKKKTDKEIYEEILTSIKRELFPQIDVNEPEAIDKKLNMLGLMIARFAEYLAGFRQLDDRDHWGNKRLESAGRSMEKLFNGLWRNLINQTQSKINEQGLNSLDEVKREISVSYIESGFFDSFNQADNWGVPGQIAKENIVENFKRDNALAAMVHVTKISVPTNRLAKQPKLRMVHESQFGFVCPAHTPEGEQCGLVKNMAITTWITLENDGGIILEKVEGKISSQPTINHTSVFWLNNRIIGWCDGKSLKEELVVARRRNELPKGTAIVLDHDNMLNVFTDGGRPTRPLLIVEDGELVINKKGLWKADIETLLREGCLEYIDAYEQDYTRIAINVADAEAKHESYVALREKREEYVEALSKYSNLTEKELGKVKETVIKLRQNLQDVNDAIYKEFNEQPFTHCEMHPSAYLGTAASLIPLINFIQGPRAVYSCAHQSQALGSFHSNHRSRYDTTFKTISHPAPPLVQTEMYGLFGMRDQPTGENIKVAFMIYGGLNQEDSLIFNRGALDRGLFRIVVYKSYKAKTEDNKNENIKEVFGRPEPMAHEDKRRYAALDENGFPIVGSYVREHDYIIGKIRRTPTGIQNASVKLGIGQEGIISEVIKIGNMIRVKIREERIPQVGDKFASRFAQKATVGAILSPEDMPYSLDGIQPDVIINPHCIPSRMTIGMLFEIVMAKTATLTGEFQDGTSHRPFDITTFQRKLVEYGYTDDGNETFINGKTGKLLKCRVFTGPCYYMALRHHVQDKIQFRGRSTVESATRQPTGGRTKGGGIRVGEMERDTMIAWGGAATLNERLCLVSDVHSVPHCMACGNIAIPNTKEETYTCPYCESGGKDIGLCEYPFVTSLFLNYLAASGIKLEFELTEKH